MANEIRQKTGTDIILANSTYSPGTNTTLGTRTDDIDCDGLTAAAARQSVKFDFTALRARQYEVTVTYEIASDPAAGGTVDLYLSPSHSATAAVGNMGLATGADGAYAATGGYTLAELLTHLQFIGSAPVAVQNDGDGVQVAPVAVFSPTNRYGCLIVVNNASVAFHSDSVEFAVRFAPIIDEVQ